MKLTFFLRFGKVKYFGLLIKKASTKLRLLYYEFLKLEFQSHFQFKFVIDGFVTNRRKD